MTTEPTRPEIAQILQDARNIGVFYANPRSSAPAHYVPAYLRSVGYRVLPIHPAHGGTVLHGEPVRESTATLDLPVDVLVIFRRPEALKTHVDEWLAMRPLPTVIWTQSGIRDDDVARQLRNAGITVVQDHCMMVEHRALAVGRIPGT